MLKVNWKTELCGNYEKDRPFGENVQIFYLSDLTMDLHLQTLVRKAPRPMGVFSERTSIETILYAVLAYENKQ